MLINHPQAGVDLIKRYRKQLDEFKPIIKHHHGKDIAR